MRTCILIACWMVQLLASSGSLWGQKVSNDLIRIRDNFTGLDQVTITLQYTVTQNGQSETQEATLIKSKGSFYQKFYGRVEQIHTPKYFVVVNHETKKISVQAGSDRQYGGLNLFQLDSILQARQVVLERLPVVNGLAGYKVPLKQGGYDQFEVYYDPAHYLPRKLVLSSAKMAYKIFVAISYNFDPKIDKKLFDIAKFVVVRDNRSVVVTEAYRGYQVINGLRK